MTDDIRAFQKSLDKMIDHIYGTTDVLDRVQFYGAVLSGYSHIQHRRDLAVAAAAGVTPQTANNWATGLSECSKLSVLYAKCRHRFASERDMAIAFGEFINRDLLAEIGL